MKTTILAAAVQVACAAVYADNRSSVLQEDKTEVIVSKTVPRDRLYAGLDVFGYNDSPKLKGIHIKDHNIYYGVRAGYDLLKPDFLYAGIEALYALGTVHIRAKSHSTHLAHKKTMGDFANVETRLGYNFHSPGSFYFSPYLGLGGYHLRSFHSVRYVQNWLYLTVGFKTDYVFNPTFSLGLNIKGMRALYLEERFKKHGTSKTYHNTNNALGYGIGLPFTWRFGKEGNGDLQLEPYCLKLNSNSNSNVLGARLTFSLCY